MRRSNDRRDWLWLVSSIMIYRIKRHFTLFRCAIMVQMRSATALPRAVISPLQRAPLYLSKPAWHINAIYLFGSCVLLPSFLSVRRSQFCKARIHCGGVFSSCSVAMIVLICAWWWLRRVLEIISNEVRANSFRLESFTAPTVFFCQLCFFGVRAIGNIVVPSVHIRWKK